MQVNMLDAKNKLSSLVAAAEQGEEVILARDGVPVAKIVKYARPKVRPPGAWKGLMPAATEWNSTETNALVESLFYGEDPSPQGSPGAHPRAAGAAAQGTTARKVRSKGQGQAARKPAIKR